jgi:thioredoxin-like negative regulator of GroEL
MDRVELQALLESQRGWLVIALWAPWCVPCKTAAPLVAACAAKMPTKVTYLHLNVDTCADVYAALKAKKQVRGIPALLAYKPENATLIADVSYSGGNRADIEAFFSKVS